MFRLAQEYPLIGFCKLMDAGLFYRNNTADTFKRLLTGVQPIVPKEQPTTE